jgi:hypothetical protein
MRSHSAGCFSKTRPRISTMKPFAAVTLLLALALAAGCSLFHRKDSSSQKARAPELPPSAGIEAEFRERWLSKRVHDLLIAKAAATEDEARKMAADEFARQYPYLAPANSGARR